MPVRDYRILLSDCDDGSIDLTISLKGEDHKFSLVARDDEAVLSHEETKTWRSQILTIEPPDAVWKAVMQSDEVTDYLDENELTSVRREEKP